MGLNVKKSVASLGGITMQPRKPSRARATDATHKKMTPLNITPPVVVDAAASEGDKLKLAPLRTTRSKFLAEMGINVFRPEIIAATRYEPAYDIGRSNQLTDIGTLLDVQIASRGMQLRSLNQFIERLRADDEIRSLFETLERSYFDQLDQAKVDVKFLIDTHTAFDNVMRRLDISNNQHSIAHAADRIVKPRTSIIDLYNLFTNYMGYSNEGFRRFSNTKLYGQLVFDLNIATRWYTPALFDIVDVERADDVDPFRYDRTGTLNAGRFSFDMKKFARANQTINAFTPKTFFKLVKSLPTNRIDRHKLLSITLSRVLSISSGLGINDVRAKFRNLSLDIEAEDQMSDLVGIPGESIFDDHYVSAPIIDVTQIVADNNDIVLPFEKRYVIDSGDKKFTPGNDYFFDNLIGAEDNFNIGRLDTFRNAITKRLIPALDIVDTCLRTNSPSARKNLGDDITRLRGNDVYKRALKTASIIVSDTLVTGNVGRNNAFIMALFDLSQGDSQLRRMLFELMFLSVAWSNVVGTNDDEEIEIFDNIIRNEVKTYADIPSLRDYEADIPVNIGGQQGDGIIAHIRFGEHGIVENESILRAAYRRVQELVIDRAMSLMTKQVNSGKTMFAGKLKYQSADIGGDHSRPMKSRDFLDRITTKKTVIKFDLPTGSDLFDTEMRDVLFNIIKFIDSLEDDAAVNRREVHLLDDRSGRSRYLSLSSSMRMSFGFELIASIFGTYRFSKFGDMLDDNRIEIVLDKTLISTFSAAVSAGVTTGKHPKMNQSADNMLNVNDSKSRINNDLLHDMSTEFKSIQDALCRDNDTVASMTATLRAVASQIIDAVDDVERVLGAQRNSMTSIQSQHASYKTHKSSRNRSTYKHVRARTTHRQNLYAKTAKKLLLSKQQAMLSYMHLRDLADINSRFWISKYMSTDTQIAPRLTQRRGRSEIRNPFIDSSHVGPGVKHALWSMLSDAKYTGINSRANKILTIGIPTGFTDRLEDSLFVDESKLESSRINRELDIINVTIYRRDLIEEDIVFKPMRIVFELSRFVSDASFNEIGVSDRTNDIPHKFSDVAFDLTSFVDMSNLNTPAARGQTGNEMLTDDRYSFMPVAHKRNIVMNHIASYLLGVYLRLLTGVDVREQSFYVAPEAIADSNDDTTYVTFAKIAEKYVSREGIGMSLTDLRARFPKFNELLLNIEDGEFQAGFLNKQVIYDSSEIRYDVALVCDELTDLAKLMGSKSVLTGGERLRQSLTTPKLFERVFNVYVDPYAFEIDVDKTNASNAGRLALRRLEAADLIVRDTDNIVRKIRHVDTDDKVFMKRQSINSDVTVDQYFVTIARYEPPGSVRPKISQRRLDTPVRKISHVRKSKSNSKVLKS